MLLEKKYGLCDSACTMRVLLVAHMLKSRNFQPFALEYLSAVLKQRGHEIRLADASFPKQVLTRALAFRPEIVGFSVTTGLHLNLVALNNSLKKKMRFLSVFGGPHATFHPALIETAGIDAVCLGEGEEAFVELVEARANGRPLRQIGNFWIKEGTELHKNPLRPLIMDLDSLPFPDWSLTDDFVYCREFPVKIFIAARGCPFACTFCSMPAYRQLYEGERFFRIREPAKVIEEIQAFQSERVLRYVYFFDDTFGVNSDFLRQFCELYAEKIRLPFCVQLRADLVNEKNVGQLAQAGLAQAALGLEVGSETRRIEMLNKKVTDAQLLEAGRLFRRFGIPLATYNLLGLPGTTVEDDLETLRLNWRVGTVFADALIFQPYPGIRLGEKAREAGLYSGDPDEIPRTFKRMGPLRLSGYRKRMRLLYLFPILVAHPVSDKVLDLLLALPLDSVYRLILRIYEGLVRTFKIYRVSIPTRVLLRIFWHYVRF